MIIRYRTTKAPKGQQTAGRGAAPAPLACYRRDARTPANGSVYKSPERAAEFFCHPFGVAFTPLTCRGSCVPSVASQRSWSGTPACGLISPSGFGGIFADNH